VSTRHYRLCGKTHTDIYRQMPSVFGTLNNAGLFQPKFGSNMDKPKCWVKNVIKKCTVESES